MPKENVEGGGASARRSFMKLPIDERRRILTEQAEKLKDYYDEDSTWREWGGGDFLITSQELNE